jgi:hypothetical protein
MGDTKRGREREGRNKRHQRLRREMERAREHIAESAGGRSAADEETDR